MRIHDFSEIKMRAGELALQDRLQGMLKYGFSWPQDIATQEKFISIIERDVDQRFTLLRNFPIPQVNVDVPMLFVGPPGARVVLISRERGIFQAKDDQWLELSGKSYRPAKDNLIRRTQLYMRSIEKVLRELGHPDVEVEGLIVGMNPGMHVDAQRSDVRVIQFDALRRLGSQWNREQPVLSPEKVYQVVTALTQLTDPSKSEEEKAASRQMVAKPGEDKFVQNLAPLQKKMNFSLQQWAVLALLLFGTVVVLLIFMFIILTSL